jgi:hypothetical protein
MQIRLDIYNLIIFFLILTIGWAFGVSKYEEQKQKIIPYLNLIESNQEAYKINGKLEAILYENTHTRTYRHSIDNIDNRST